MRNFESKQVERAVPSGKEASTTQDHERSVNSDAGKIGCDAGDMRRLGRLQETKACAHAPPPCNTLIDSRLKPKVRANSISRHLKRRRWLSTHCICLHSGILCDESIHPSLPLENHTMRSGRSHLSTIRSATNLYSGTSVRILGAIAALRMTAFVQ